MDCERHHLTTSHKCKFINMFLRSEEIIMDFANHVSSGRSRLRGPAAITVTFRITCWLLEQRKVSRTANSGQMYFEARTRLALRAVNKIKTIYYENVPESIGVKPRLGRCYVMIPLLKPSRGFSFCKWFEGFLCAHQKWRSCIADEGLP